MAKAKYNLKLGVFLRWARTIIPQIPAVTAYLVDLLSDRDLPVWVVPVLVFVGSLFTALDKLIREVRK